MKSTLLMPCSWTSRLQSLEEINFCGWSHPVWDTLFWQPEQTNADPEWGFCSYAAGWELLAWSANSPVVDCLEAEAELWPEEEDAQKAKSNVQIYPTYPGLGFPIRDCHHPPSSDHAQVQQSREEVRECLPFQSALPHHRGYYVITIIIACSS